MRECTRGDANRTIPYDSSGGRCVTTPAPAPVSATDWVAGLSPWPADGFGLERMRALLAELGDPQLRFPAVHVVGTNGKSTTTRSIAATLAREGLRAGAYTSPHVAGWSERIFVEGADADFERAVVRVRPAAQRLGATQFEILTAAALTEFAEREVDAAVVEAGLGGRLDATKRAPAPSYHAVNGQAPSTDARRDARGDRAREARRRPSGRPSCSASPSGSSSRARTGPPQCSSSRGGTRRSPAPPLPRSSAARSSPRRRSSRAGSTVAATSSGMEHLHGGPSATSSPTCRHSQQSSRPSSPTRTSRAFSSRSAASRPLSSRPALRIRVPCPRRGLALRGEPYFQHVESVPDPQAARRRARELAGPAGLVLVTGSLYLLADLSADG